MFGHGDKITFVFVIQFDWFFTSWITGKQEFPTESCETRPKFQPKKEHTSQIEVADIC